MTNVLPLNRAHAVHLLRRRRYCMREHAVYRVNSSLEGMSKRYWLGPALQCPTVSVMILEDHIHTISLGRGGFVGTTCTYAWNSSRGRVVDKSNPRV